MPWIQPKIFSFSNVIWLGLNVIQIDFYSYKHNNNTKSVCVCVCVCVCVYNQR